MKLKLFLTPSEVEFTEPLEAGSLPWLLSVGSLVLVARAGHITGQFSNENANLTLSLDNKKGQAFTIIGRPLRVRGEVYDGSDLFFAGFVQSIAYGTTIQLTLEA